MLAERDGERERCWQRERWREREMLAERDGEREREARKVNDQTFVKGMIKV